MRMWLVGGIISAVAVALPSFAAEPRVDFSSPQAQAWADKMFGQAFEQGRFSGLGVIAVQDGAVKFARTYGYADAGLKKPIDPAVTRFRVGSISKTFTALGIAVLLNDGRIASLDDPANQYLKRVHLPKIGTREVTLWDLLTHRSGFENMAGASDPARMPLSSEDIAKNIPKLQPSIADTSNYCNACAGILGIVTEDVSGQLLQDFLAERVFRPLAMNGSILNTSRNPSVEVGVPYAMGGHEPVRLAYDGGTEFRAPAGDVDAPLLDMGNYMMALLGGPRSEILSSKTPNPMFTVHARNATEVSGFGMVWMIRQWDGPTVYEHGGGLGSYNSLVAFFPGSNAGIFISCLCVPPSGPGAPFMLSGFNFSEMIYREFLGVPAAPSTVRADASQYAGLYEGEGRDSRWPRRIERLLTPLAEGGFTRVTSENGALTINGQGPYYAVGKNMFHASLNAGDPYIPYANSETFVFTQSADGAIKRATRSLSVRTMRLIGFAERPDTLQMLGLLATCLGASGFFVSYWRFASERTRRLALWVEHATATVVTATAVSLTSAVSLGWLRQGMALTWDHAVDTVLLVLAAIVLLAAVAATVIAIGLGADG